MHMLPRSTPGQGKQNRVRALLAGRRLRCRRRRGRAIATIMALDRAIRHAGDGGSVYDERGLLFL